LWDVATGAELLSHSGYEAAVRCLAFRPDDKALATGHADSTILVWDVIGLGNQSTARPALSERQLHSLWDALTSPDAGQAGRAIWSLAADPHRAAPFLLSKLRGLLATEPQRIPKLVSALDSANYKARVAAEKQLIGHAKLAVPSLNEALDRSASLEVRRRIELILAKREAPFQVPDVLRMLRALEVLEHIGSPEARRALDEVARQETEPYFRAEARAAAERLAKRP
jgi:hypothetical protein